MEGKKTWLYIKSCELNAHTELWFKETDLIKRVQTVRQEWQHLGLDKMILEKSKEYNKEGMRILNSLAGRGVKTDGLTEILDFLAGRSH